MKTTLKLQNRLLVLLLCGTMLLGSIPLSGTAAFADDEKESEGTVLTSEVTNMDLAGYVGENLIGNVKNWQIEAYRNNRGIVDQIAIANSEGLALEKLLGADWFGVDSHFDIDVHDKDGGKALGFTMKKVPTAADTASFDRDIRFANDPSAATDWSGAEYLQIRVDASDIDSAVKFRVAFEENAVGRESFSLNTGSAVTLIDDQKGESTVTVTAGGFFTLPASFKGKILLPLNTTAFSRYWQEGGNGKLDLSKVVQFQLSVKGDFVGKTFFIDDFSTVDAQNTAKSAWSIDGVSKRNSYTGSIMIWYGEFVGKLLTGMAYCYRATPDEALKDAADEIITDLAKAQGKDGYLGVFLGGARYSISSGNWDLWNQYHCIVGLVEWYKLTGSDTALEVAKKCLDCIYDTFKDRSYIVAGGEETNRGIAHGYAMMYQVTGEQKYLDEAIRIIEKDCKGEKNSWYDCALKGRDFASSKCLRWEVLHMVMTLGILYEETGNKEYYEVMSFVWESVLKTDVHNGGTFTTNEGACGDPFAEGIVETCCTIAWAALTNEYYRYNQSVRVADELERSYLNGVLGGLLDDDKYCTYNTPQDGIEGSADFHGGGYDGRRVPSQKDIAFQYNSTSPDMNCCQANYARGIGQLSGWAVMSGENALYLNYYGPSAITTKVGDKTVTLTQKTEYPLNGKVSLTVSGLEQDTAFTLNLRIPTWAHGSTVSFDGKTVNAKSGEYFEIDKTFKNGDTIELNIALSFTYQTGERAQKGFASVFYGPVLLTLDNYYAPNAPQSTALTVKEIENAVISAGGQEDAMLFFDLTVGNETLRLVDFASAGKYHENPIPSTYYSWLTITDAPESKEGVTWQNTDKIKIFFGENLMGESALAYAGDTVKFTVSIPEGQVIDKITSSIDDLAITLDGDTGSFTMPEEEVTLSVSFKEGGNDPIDPPQAGDATAIIAVLAIVAGCALFVVLKKKKA